jgi:hypothetical protein
MKLVLMITTVICANLCYAQKVNYKDIRPLYLNSCGTDTLMEQKALKALLKIELNEIDENVDLYYYDLAYIYFKLGFSCNNNRYKEWANLNYRKAIRKNPGNLHVLWDGAISLVFTHHCKEAMKWLNNYIKLADKKDIDTAEVNSLRNICNSR